MTQRFGASGFLKGENWDDGSNHDGVSKIYIRCASDGIKYIYFDYVKDEEIEEGSRHGYPYHVVGTKTIEINHLENEHLESVSGTLNSDGLRSLVFKSNFRTFEPIMASESNQLEDMQFTQKIKGKKIIGFHGTASSIVHSIGTYFTWITPTRVEAKGGRGGKEWDDGYEQEDVSMIRVQGGLGGIQSIQFDYVSGKKKKKKGRLHGASSGGVTVTNEINYRRDEFLVSVEGYYDEGSRAIQGIQFRTNINKFEMVGNAKGRKFTLADNGNKITGFHGHADMRALISLGAYFRTTSSKLERVGDSRGQISWDDGSGYDGIRKVFVDATTSVRCIRFEYANRGKVIKTPRRGFIENEGEFVINYPNEFITAVEGSLTLDGTSFSSLTIKTSEGRTSKSFGDIVTQSKFVLEKPGNILVGFYGTTDEVLTSLGAYYRPLPPPPNTEKLEGQGGDGGDYWDDGSTFSGIRKICIGLTDGAIAFVKFMYVQKGRAVFGDDHGSKTISYLQEFGLDSPKEYLISVEGDYDDTSGVITMLRFTTNKDNYTVGFGRGEPSFLLHKSGYQIVGFHGKSSDMLHQIGVHALPIN